MQKKKSDKPSEQSVRKAKANMYAGIKDTLILEKNKVGKQLKKYVSLLKEGADQVKNRHSQHPASEVDSGENFDDMARRCSWQLKRIGLHIKKINEGTYGFCTDCGDQIPLARLQACIYTNRCIECAKLDEKCKGH